VIQSTRCRLMRTRLSLKTVCTPNQTREGP
jgi:hypothetical protein